MGRTIALLLSALAFLSPPVFRESGAASNAPGIHPRATSSNFPGLQGMGLPDLGFDMSYNPAMQMGNHHVFDNVFVNPEAYKPLWTLALGRTRRSWFLEVRGAQGKGSINQSGNFQAADVMGLEFT